MTSVRKTNNFVIVSDNLVWCGQIRKGGNNKYSKKLEIVKNKIFQTQLTFFLVLHLSFNTM